jgi:hypothetical protein
MISNRRAETLPGSVKPRGDLDDIALLALFRGVGREGPFVIRSQQQSYRGSDATSVGQLSSKASRARVPAGVASWFSRQLQTLGHTVRLMPPASSCSCHSRSRHTAR